MRLLGLAGRARSGKDTVGEILARRHGFVRHAFASPIKDGLAAMLDLDKHHLEGDLKEQPIPWLGKSPRELMQSLGTEWGRQMVHPGLWLLRAEERRKALASFPEHPGLVITDVRFDNEADWVRAAGGVIIHIRRPGANAPAVRSHCSEAGVFEDEHDWVLYNEGSLADLEATVLSLMQKLAAVPAEA